MRALSSIRTQGGKTEPETLLGSVDMVSSTSGGSVPAAFLALVGPERIGEFEERFLNRDAPLVRNFLMRLPAVLTNGTERIDVQIDWLDSTLFDGAKYRDLWDSDKKQWRRPFLLLNATDIGIRSVFPFHQNRFDLLCSDLSSLKLSTAVAASAAFPVLLNPVTLTNYSNRACDPYVKGGSYGMPRRFRHSAVRTDENDEEHVAEAIQANPNWLFRARKEYSYTARDLGKPVRPYVHLLDGGIADNLGLTEALWMLVSLDNDTNPAWEIFGGAVSRVVIIVVNAQTKQIERDDLRRRGPGIYGMFRHSVDGAMSSSVEAILRETRDTLEFMEGEKCKARLGQECDGKCDIECDGRRDTVLSRVGLRLILDDECRERFMAIPTSWNLEPAEINALVEIAEPLVWRDVQFRRFVRQWQDFIETPAWSLKRAIRREKEVCDVLLGR